MAQQTAVEWLIMQLPVKIRVELYEQNIHEQAKEMEKEQIFHAFDKGKWDTMAFKGTLKEQYYNQTYGKE